MSGQFTTAGLTRIANYGLSATGFPYIAQGDGTATFALALAAMGDEVLRQAIASSVSAGPMTDFKDYLFNAQAVGTLSETGLWDDASAGNLLAYEPFYSSIVKSDDRSMVVHFVTALRNLSSAGILTSSGMAALRANGFTYAAFPYFAVGSGTNTAFKSTMDAMGTEIARTPVSVITEASGVMTIAAFWPVGSGTGTWKEFGLWDASSGGNLLAYGVLGTAYAKAAGVARESILTVTMANEA
jgi:hypothetical protein